MDQKKVFNLAINTVTEEPNNESDFIFIVKESDCVNYSIDTLFKNEYPTAKICIINDHREGPVISVLKVKEFIPDDEEIIISYCDLFINWNFNNFINFCRESKSDASLATHINWHPHRVYNNYFCYLRTDNKKVLEIKEKQHFTDNPLNEPASSGVYYFKSGALLKKYFNKLVDKNIKVNNEFYVTLPYNLMIEDNLNITHYIHENYFCLGTPKDIEIIQSFITLKQNVFCDTIRVVEYFQKYYTFD